MSNVVPIAESAALHNLELEQALLGALLQQPEALDRIEFVRPEHFFEPLHQRIYRTMRSLLSQGRAISAAGLKTYFREDEAMDMHGGAQAYLGRLRTVFSMPAHAEDYGRGIVELWQRREAAEIYREGLAALADPQADQSASAVLSLIQSRIGEIEADGPQPRLQAIGGMVSGVLETVQDAMNGRIVLPSTGLACLDDAIGGLDAGDLALMAGRPGMGKAQPLDAMIAMADGTWRAMGTISFGDELASIDGQPSRVVGVYPQGRRKVYRVTLSDGRSTRCCGEHLWTVTSTRWRGGEKVLTTDDLRTRIGTARYRRRIRVPVIASDAVPDVALPVDPWLLGVLLGNGNLTNGSVMVSIADAATLYGVQQLLGQGITAKASGDYDYRLTSQKGAGNWLLDALGDLGLRGHRSEQKFIPEIYMRASWRQRLALLQGLIDTDGWVETFGALRYSTSSPILAEQVCRLVRSLGGVCSTSTKSPHYPGPDGERRSGLTHHVLNIRHSRPRDLVTLKRKARRVPEEREAPLTIVSIEPDGEAEVQCIAVSHPSNLYVTDDYIVTHNTAKAVSLARKAVTANEGFAAAFFSLEMPGRQIVLRMACEMASTDAFRIPYSLARRGRINQNQLRALAGAEADVGRLPIYIDDTPGRTASSIAAECRRLKRDLEHKGMRLGLVVVDHLRKVRDSGNYRNNANKSEGEKASDMKNLAKELGCTVMALVQLSRDLERRENKRPVMSDLRDSGEIEEEADIVLFPFREHYYRRRQEPNTDKDPMARMNWEADLKRLEGRMELIVGKNRQGEEATLHIGCDMATNRFWDFAEQQAEEGFI
ncbi:MAG: AAA family ATPase [Alphaproteobacteria bacterium]|nr:AAA family ATPase [Alphaproteobacteria bacterium]